jgi:hypothetical protein
MSVVSTASRTPKQDGGKRIVLRQNSYARGESQTVGEGGPCSLEVGEKLATSTFINRNSLV